MAIDGNLFMQDLYGKTKRKGAACAFNPKKKPESLRRMIRALLQREK